jgi:hypothetical protein
MRQKLTAALPTIALGSALALDSRNTSGPRSDGVWATGKPYGSGNGIARIALAVSGRTPVQRPEIAMAARTTSDDR